MAPKKNKSAYKPWPQKNAAKQNTENKGPKAYAWAVQPPQPPPKAQKTFKSASPSLGGATTAGTNNTRPPPKARKTFDLEFPALAGTSTAVIIDKENWVSPDELQDPNQWQTGGVHFDSWNHGVGENGTVATSEPTPWVDPTPEKTAAILLKYEVYQKCMGWPWNKTPLDQLKVKTLNSPFFGKLMDINDVALLVLKEVFKYHSSAWQLAATCQKFWDLVSSNVDIWDMTSGWFNNCDNIGAQNDPFTAGSVSAHLIVSPLRRPEGPASYLEQVRSIRGLCLSVYNFGQSLRNIHFHRVPFLNINVLALLIPQMTKLENLGIFNCRLMHLGTGLRLLEILRTDRLKGKEHSISLDFYPNYHLGPEDGGYYSVGTYGVCWDNLNFDTCMGIWSLTKRIVMQARKQGIDLESPHTQFRQWLDKTPCWAVGDTLKSFFDPKMKTMQVAAMVQYRFSYGRPSRLTSKLGYTHDCTWWGRDVRCETCLVVQMGVFFSIPHAYKDQAGAWRHPECYGCRLTWDLRREQDHYKAKKRCVIKKWLKDPIDLPDTNPWNTADLRRALEDYDLRGIEQMAAELDETRRRQIKHGSKRPDSATFGTDPYDPETEERQRPLTHQERNGKRGTHRRSPDVFVSKGEEKAFFEDPIKGEHKWCIQHHDKYDGHGHIY